MHRRSCLAISLAFGLAACSGPSFLSGDEIRAPDVSLAGLSFSEPGPTEQILTVRLRLKNPNAVDTPIHHVAFALDIKGKPFASGLTREAVTLPASGEIVVPVDIAIPTTDLVERVTAVGTGERLDYTLSGEAEIGSWFSDPAPFSRDGKLALPQLPQSDQTKKPS